MPANPWLAIDVATPPRKRARELKRLWERFLGNGKVDAVRPPIADSWRRSRAAGVDLSAPTWHRFSPTKTRPQRAGTCIRWPL